MSASTLVLILCVCVCVFFSLFILSKIIVNAHYLIYDAAYQKFKSTMFSSVSIIHSKQIKIRIIKTHQPVLELIQNKHTNVILGIILNISRKNQLIIVQNILVKLILLDYSNECYTSTITVQCRPTREVLKRKLGKKGVH